MDIKISKQYSFRSQPFYKLVGHTIAMVDRDHMNRSFYEQKLSEHNLVVVGLQTLEELAVQIMSQPIHAAVINLETDNLKKHLAEIGKLTRKYPMIPVVTIGQNMQEMELDAIMKTGSKLHLNKDLSHPRDILIALEQVIN